MASIKGITVKNLHTFRGEEYPTNYQGNIYFNGKLQGFWSQDGWGGPDRYEFNSTELEKIASDYYNGEPYYDLDCLMNEVIALIEYEKKYKKAIKEGYSAFVVIADAFKRETWVKVPMTTDKEVIRAKCQDLIKKLEAETKKPVEDVKIFTDLADFVK